MNEDTIQRSIERRREFHTYPEPSWCEFLTTSRLVDALEEIGVDELHVGREAIEPEDRMGLPETSTLEEWHERAEEGGARSDVLEQTTGGTTGVVATLDRGPGPVVGLRVDIDALPIEEADDLDHVPAEKGFQSRNGGVMHACGHDAHMAIGLAVLETLAEREFDGTVKVFFQPAEEVLGGGAAMAGADHPNDLDAFFAVHVGMNYPTGTVVAGSDKPLAVRQSRATFTGQSVHAGFAPQEGRYAMQAMAAAIQNLYGISRHADDLTRVNVGRADAGVASNVVADRASIELEARAGSNDVLEYVTDRVDRILRTAADMHECELSTEVIGQAPRVDSDEGLAELVAEVASGVEGVTEVVPRAPFGASEDVTFLMRRAREAGGQATFVIVGTDHPGNHHSPRFDIDEESLGIGIETLTEAIERVLAGDGPVS